MCIRDSRSTTRWVPVWPSHSRERFRVVELVKAQHAKAVQILTDNRAKLDELAQYLYQKEKMCIRDSP